MFDIRTHLYISMPRTGSTSSRRILALQNKKHKLPPSLERHHVPARLAPPGFLQQRTVVGTIRPPMDWYLSAFMHSPKNKAWLHWGNGDPTWGSCLYGMTHPWELKRYENLSGPIHGPNNVQHLMKNWKQGFWTYQVHWWYMDSHNQWLVNHLIDTRNVVEGWARLLGNKIKPLKKNASSGTRPKITPEMKEWVQTADGNLRDQLYRGRTPIHPLFGDVA